MARTESKTVRFTRVVEQAGQPHVHTLWLPPDKDPELKRARDTHRVMTLERAGGSGRTDFGIVGFDPQRDKARQLLIFPKSLAAFEGARVIGVKFDLIAQPKVAPAAAAASKSKARPSSRETPVQAPRASVAPLPHKENARAETKTAKTKTVSRRASSDTAFLREVRAAMKDLQRGKAVAAYQRLERALAAAAEA